MYAQRRSFARLAPCLALSLLACSGEDFVDANGDGVADGIQAPNNVTVVTPTQPMGHVAGILRDALNDEPLSGVKVELAAGGLPDGFEPTLNTDTSGTFEFGPLAAGAAFSLSFSVEGYASVLLPDLIIDDTAGNFPTLNGALYIGPLRLLRTGGTFSVQVVSAEGAAVPNARVTVETGARYLMVDTPRGTAAVSGATNTDGVATLEGLPDVWSLPPSLEAAGSVVVHVDAVDLDANGSIEWAGATRSLSGRELRDNGRTLTVVLNRPVQTPLAPIASNIGGLLAPTSAPSVLEAGDPVRVVLNKSIDRDSVVVDLRDEKGESALVSTLVVSGYENILEIGSATGLDAGREYNLSLRMQAQDVTPLDVLELSSPFFVRDVRDRAITVTGRFVDINGDGAWGSGNDEVQIELSTPLGRPNAVPAFTAELYLDLDINGTSTVGDGAGELPRSGADYPSPIVLSAGEPVPANGAGRSGFTRYFAARAINLPVSLTNPAGSVSFEVRFPAQRNGGHIVATPGGREVPVRLSGTLSLARP